MTRSPKPGEKRYPRLRIAGAMVGRKFGALFILSDEGSNGRESYVLCRCECGTQRKMRASDIKTGRTVSCGCVGKKNQKIAVTKHGKWNTRSYRVWTSMKQRCGTPSHAAFASYGGRGITVCDRWLSFANFLADMGDPPEGLELDRINNDGNYEPGNCKWSTVAEQAGNRRGSRKITYDGETKCLSQWAAQVGICPSTLTSRLERGWRLAEALSYPRIPPKFCRNRSLILRSHT